VPLRALTSRADAIPPRGLPDPAPLGLVDLLVAVGADEAVAGALADQRKRELAQQSLYGADLSQDVDTGTPWRRLRRG
jgi:hypothetical protein